MKELINIAAAIIAVYVEVMIILGKKIPTSISDTYYLTGTSAFTLTMWSVALLFGIGATGLTPANWEPIVFLTSVGLMFVGAACHCRDKYQMPVHYAGAIAFVIGSQVWVGLVGSPWVLMSFISATGYLFSGNRIFWLEINCIVNLTIATILA